MAGIVNKSRRDETPKRTREHHIADLSANYIEKIVLEKGYVVEGFRHDYGYDLSLYTYLYAPGSTDGEYENDSVKIQLKATDSISIRFRGQFVCFQVTQQHLNLWGGETMPVILIVYDVAGNTAYWLHMQPYIAGLKAQRTDSRVVRIPTANRVDADAVEAWRQLKISRQAAIKGAGL